MAHLARSWPAFDLALSVYWSRAHPGEPLDEFINRDSVLNRAARTVGLSQQINATVTDIIGPLSGIAGAGYRIANTIYNRIKSAISSHRVLRNCELLPTLLEAEADAETLSYLPYLLAWDLDNAGIQSPGAVVFLDTYEAVTGRITRDVERWLQRSVFLMPNTLFVVTGRNRLDWAELQHADELDFVGPERWPLLAPGAKDEPRQHLVGYLSAVDANHYLETTLVDDGRPAMPAEIRERIVTASAGLPLYLDLAVTRYLDLLSRRKRPSAMDFGQPLPAVAAQVLKDLGPHERALLRAAALLDGFNLDTLRAACPQVPDAALRSFKDRPFLEVDQDRLLPYSLHDVLRQSILQADTDLPDSWSARERGEVAGRIIEHFGRVTAAAREAGDVSTEVTVFRQALDLCALTGRFDDWLIDSAQHLLMAGRWAEFSDRRQIDDSPVSALVHRAHALRVAGRYYDASLEYETLWRHGGDFADEAGYWLGDYAYLDGRFNDALAALDQLDNPDPDLASEILRLRGHIHRVNALFPQAESYYRQALDLARQTGNEAAEGKALTDLVQTLAWTRPNEALELRPQAAELNQALGNIVELVKIHAATAVAATNQGDKARAETETDQGLTLTLDCGYRGGQIWCWAARAFAAARQHNRDAHQAATTHIATIVDQLGGNRFWTEITHWLADTDTQPAHTTHWIDGRDQAKQRWTTTAASTNQSRST